MGSSLTSSAALTSVTPSRSTYFLKMSATGGNPAGMRLNLDAHFRATDVESEVVPACAAALVAIGVVWVAVAR